MRNRTRVRRVFCLLAVLLLCFAQAGFSRAETKSSGSFTYEVQEDGTATITEYSNRKITELEIPSELDGYQVTAIGPNVFKLKRNLQRVIVPEGVVSIGTNAFSSCDGIISLSLPKSLEEIGDRAFSNCKGLRSVKLSAKLGSMGENPFALCDNLSEVVIDAENKVFEVRDGSLINKEEGRLISWLHQTRPDGSYKVPEDIRVIGASAFVECKELTGVLLPEGLEVIEESAFNRCDALTEVVLPETLTTLRNKAFADCDLLSAVRIPLNLTDMDGNPFMACELLTSVIIPQDHPTLELRAGVMFNKVEEKLLCYPAAKPSTEYTVPEGTLSIGKSAFENSRFLVHVTIADTVTSIGENAFSNCSVLEECNWRPLGTTTAWVASLEK